MTPESGSAPSTATGVKDDGTVPNGDGSNFMTNGDKTVQILQIEPRYSMTMEDGAGSDGDVGTVSLENGGAEKRKLKRMETFDKDVLSRKGDDRVFEAMSNEFNQTLRNEKIRLQKSIDEQMRANDVIKIGQNGSVIDSIQNAQVSVGKITNGISLSGYDMTQIKDENGRTVLHLAAAKEQKPETLYKMLMQAKYLVPERDSKYRTIRDVAVMNGIKPNLRVVDMFIIDSFVKKQKDYIKMLAMEGYSNLLSVVDSDGNDVISILQKNGINGMDSLIHDLAQFQVFFLNLKFSRNFFLKSKQKNRDELHTFIRNGYIEGVSPLIESDPRLVSAKSDRSRTSLHLAVLFGNLDIIEMLINVNYKVVNIPDNVGLRGSG